MYDSGSGTAGSAGAAAVLAATGTNVGLYLSVALAFMAIGFIIVGLRRRTRQNRD